VLKIVHDKELTFKLALITKQISFANTVWTFSSLAVDGNVLKR
jgi:hypothetical protein